MGDLTVGDGDGRLNITLQIFVLPRMVAHNGFTLQYSWSFNSHNIQASFLCYAS